MNFEITLIFTLFLSISGQNTSYLPTVIWHGMGDTCCSFGMNGIADLIKQELPGIHVHQLMIGTSESEDRISGFLGNSSEIIQEACDKIAADPLLQGGFNSVGFSQGSQFLRAVAQRCPNPPMNNLVSLGGQHQGVYGFPNCDPIDIPSCDTLRDSLTDLAYMQQIQDRLVQAQYWHDPIKVDDYRNFSIFLADINQENVINEMYRTNLKNLQNFVMVKFINDTMVIPTESQLFGFYAPGQDIVVQTLQESVLYTEDRLGLQEMDQLGKLHFMELEGDHLQFSDQWFVDEIVKVYLNDIVP